MSLRNLSLVTRASLAHALVGADGWLHFAAFAERLAKALPPTSVAALNVADANECYRLNHKATPLDFASALVDQLIWAGLTCDEFVAFVQAADPAKAESVRVALQ